MKKFGFRNKQGQEPVSIACQPGYVAAARVAIAAGKPHLLHAHVEPVAATGSAEKLDAATRALRLKQADIRLLLDSGEYQFLQTEMPQVEAIELKNALKWQLKDLLRFPVEQCNVETLIIPSDSNNARRPTGYAVAAANELILDRMLRVRTSRSRVSVLDIPETAQRNIATALEDEGRATAVLSITENGGLYTVSRGGVLYFTRTFDIAQSALATSEEVRRTLFDRLLLELQRSMDVLERQFSFLSVSTLWLAPFDHSDELLSLLIESLDLPVRSIDLAQLFHCAPEVLPASANEQSVLFFALGLSLHQSSAPGQAINLVDAELIPKQPVFPLNSQAIALGVILFGLILIIVWASTQLTQLEQQAVLTQKRLKDTEQRVNALAATLAKRMPDPAVAQRLSSMQLELHELDRITELLRTGGGTSTRGYSPQLDGLAAYTVPGVWLTGFNLNGPRIDLEGMTTRADLLPAYLQGLQRIPVFQGQTFAVFEMQKQKAAGEEQAKKPQATAFRLMSRSQAGREESRP